jgi:predicted nucleic acid-binding protein
MPVNPRLVFDTNAVISAVLLKRPVSRMAFDKALSEGELLVSKDNKFLELALSGQADCIVSGDHDLLVLHPFRGIPIVTPRGFLGQVWNKQ